MRQLTALFAEAGRRCPPVVRGDRELVVVAWLARAPKRLAKDYLGGSS